MVVMTLKPQFAMRVLLERLNWPVRFVRWQSAVQFAKLFSSSRRNEAIKTYLDWLKSRQFETEILSGLAILQCTEPCDRPSAADVKKHIKKSSILAELLFQRLYGKLLGGWTSNHSGSPPSNFKPDRYFEDYQGQVIPQILATQLKRLEKKTGLPFMEQWAFEWRTLMDFTKSPHSSFPHYFLRGAYSREDLSVQLSQSQCNVYRSAYLRTFAFAVQQWNMPKDQAVLEATCCLPLNNGLLSIEPTARPKWLGDVPEKAFETDAPIEGLIRQLLASGVASNGMRPVSLRIPISNAVADFGELLIQSFYASDDFTPKPDFTDNSSRMLVWPIDNLISIECPLPEEEPDDFRIDGIKGCCIPICLDTLPMPFGFWQGDYFSLGLAFPAPYNSSSQQIARMAKGKIETLAEGKRVGRWSTWNDNWSPVHPKEGRTRCGSLAELSATALDSTATKLGMKLVWHARLDTWHREKDYGSLKRTIKSEFFRE
jgi:hypothetical protein